MNEDYLIDSIGRLDEDIIQRVNEVRISKKSRPNSRKWFSMAACIALFLSVVFTAEATSGTVSNLLAPLFGGAQTEIVDEIGVPIGASTTVDGYTLTADAIIGDRHNLAIVYTLSREDGQPIPEKVFFKEWQTDVIRGTSGGGSLRTVEDEEHPNVIHFVESWHRRVPLIGRVVTASFSTLAIYNEGEEDTILSDGTWKLTYTLRHMDSSEKLPVDDFFITDDGGNQYELNSILLSPVGIHLDMTLQNASFEYFNHGAFHDFNVRLALKDGTEIPLEGGGGGGMTEGDKTAEVAYSAMFDIPVPREDIKSIMICDAVYEMNQTD